MNIVPYPSEILDYCIYFSLKQFIFICFFIFELGYYFGRIRRFRKKSKFKQQPKNNNLAIEWNQQLVQNHKNSQLIVQQSDNLIDLQKDLQGQPTITESRKNIKSSESTLPSEDQLTRQFLNEKINLEGKKIQSRGIFQMTFQKASNQKFLRKIQKHQIITDYQIPTVQNGNGQIIPFGSKKIIDLNDQSSILEINTYENVKLNKFPLVEKRLIKINQLQKMNSYNNNNFHIPFSPSLCQNGKFNKFFVNSKKIGQGAFGIVYSARSILQGKQYALKKLFIKSGVSKQRIQKMLNESIKQVNIVSQYTHPNIVRFYTCWLQMANLNEAILFNKLYYKQHLDEYNDISIINSSTDLNFKKKKNNESYIECSYISSQANSGFAFEGQSKKNTAKNISSKKINQQSPSRAVSRAQKNNDQFDQKQNFSQYAPVFALYIQMQLCKQGSLDKYLQRRKRVNRNFAFLVITQLLNGVNYLHSHGLVHRDLKPGNVLINKSQRLIKIGDFGLSANINEQIQYGKIGTPSYIAPQILEKKLLRKEDLPLIDVYSIGVIFYELLSLFNVTTKHQKSQKINKLKHGKVQMDNKFLLQKKLIKLMTKTKNRPTIKEIFQRQQYIQLKNIVSEDKQIFQNWNQVSGLQDYQN